MESTIEELQLFSTAITLDDFVMLGTTVPEPDRDGRIVVCSAGVSEKGLTRLHPLDWRNIPKRWKRYQVSVKRNNKDSRDESFMPFPHNVGNRAFEELGTLPKNARKAMLEPYEVGSIQEANERRISLAILKPDDVEVWIDKTDSDCVKFPRKWFYDDDVPLKARERFPWCPRISFRDEVAFHPGPQLRDWGAWEWMRKNHEFSPEELQATITANLHLGDQSCLFVGNYLHHRNAWCVISVLNGIR